MLDFYGGLIRTDNPIALTLSDLSQRTAVTSTDPHFALSIGAEYGLGIERRAWAGREVWGHPGSTMSLHDLEPGWDAPLGLTVTTCVTRVATVGAADADLRYPRRAGCSPWRSTPATRWRTQRCPSGTAAPFLGPRGIGAAFATPGAARYRPGDVKVSRGRGRPPAHLRHHQPSGRRGKTTLTENLLLAGGAIRAAGAVRARGEQRRTRSDWMKIERERGISVSASAMTFDHDGLMFNLLDTPATRTSRKTPIAPSPPPTRRSWCWTPPGGSSPRP